MPKNTLTKLLETLKNETDGHCKDLGKKDA